MVHGMLLLAHEASRLNWARLQAEEKGEGGRELQILAALDRHRA